MASSVLLVTADRHELERIPRLVEPRHHRVTTAPTFAGCLAALQSRSFDVLLLDQALFPRDSTDLQARLRGASTVAPFAVAIVAADAASPLRLLDAGFDDFIRRPLHADDVIARLEAPARYARFAERRPTAATDWDRSFDAARVPGWQDPGALLGEALAQMTGMRTRIATEVASPAKSIHTEMLLSVPAHEMAVRILLGGETAVVEHVARALLGSTSSSRADLEDVLGEIANTFAGVLKEAATGVSMSLGLPQAVGDDSWPPGAGPPVSRSFRLEGASGLLTVTLRCLGMQPITVPAGRLTEGMVVAHDVFSGSGALLLSAGTRVTAASADRLARALGERFGVAITRPTATACEALRQSA